MTPRLLIATTNPGKVREIFALLGDIGARLVTPPEVGLALEVDETGATYAENAKRKALVYAAASGLVTFGDDSGLEVDALGGAPGLHTARFAGPGASDADRIRLLLQKLEGIPGSERTARFRCAVAIAEPGGETAIAEGMCEGRIAIAPSGINGFGYDPVFFLPEHGCTMAELHDRVKNSVSHRARAVLAAQPMIVAALRRSARPEEEYE